MKLGQYFRMTLVMVACALWPTAAAQDEADWNWMARYFPVAFEDLFPLPRDRTVSVSFRSHRDLHNNQLEYSFAFFPKEVRVRMAEGKTIYDQMMAMRLENREESFENIRKRLKVNEWRVAYDSCGAARRQEAKLYKVKFRPPERDVIIFHPMVYEFRILSGLGDMRIDLYDDSHPLVRWGLETRRVLDGCLADKKAN